MAPRKAQKPRLGQIEKAERQQQQKQLMRCNAAPSSTTTEEENEQPRPTRQRRPRQPRGVGAARNAAVAAKPMCRVCTDLSGGTNQAAKTSDLSNTPKYLALLQELIVNLCRAVPSAKIKKLQNQLHTLYNDKVKLEQAAKRKKHRFFIQQMQRGQLESGQQELEDEQPSTSRGRPKQTKMRAIKAKPQSTTEESDDDDDED